MQNLLASLPSLSLFSHQIHVYITVALKTSVQFMWFCFLVSTLQQSYKVGQAENRLHKVTKSDS